MMFASTRAWAAALTLSLAPVPLAAGADSVPPSAVALLFEAKHVEGLEKGAKLAYRFDRLVSDEKLLGAPFSDDITIEVSDVSDAGRRLLMQIFTGERARDPQDIPDFTGNPLLILFLDRSVNNYNLVAGGERNYLKGAFRKALADKAKVEPHTIAYDGKNVAGYRITVLPYDGDRNAAKMQGYEKSTFSFVVSPAVPGHFVEFVSTVESSQPNLPRVEERMIVAGAAKTGEAK